MMMLQLEQGTQEWLDIRKGVITASRFKDVVTPAKAEKSKSAKSYMYELLAEKMGATIDSFKSSAMERGNELEPEARSTFEFLTDLKVKEVGFVLHDNGLIGVSPDGLIGEDGGLEIKCPLAKTHIKYLIDGVLPLEYKPQVMGNLWVTERKYWYFMSYHPELPPFILRVERDEKYIKKLSDGLLAFADDVQVEYEKLTK